MTTLEAMKQALAALESYSESVYIKHYHPKRFASGRKAIASLKAAIEHIKKQEQGALL